MGDDQGLDFLEDNIDENHEKSHDRDKRRADSENHRDRRAMIRDKKQRQQDKGYHGSV